MKEEFRKHIFETNVKGSNKASSYIRALDMLGAILSLSQGPFRSIKSIWDELDPKVIHNLYGYVLVHQKSGEIFQTEHPPSYWRNGYYSAALKNYREFLIEYSLQEKISLEYEKPFNPKNFEKEIQSSDFYIQEYGMKYGKEKITEVKTRVGQNVFRKEILKIYQNQCCISGLNIPQINRASHIIPWAENKETRMDPSNGLCLSATYDAAFDKHLISLDEDYRIILSKEIKEYYTKGSVSVYFHKFEGHKIQMPFKHIPNQDYIKKHRKKMVV